MNLQLCDKSTKQTIEYCALNCTWGFLSFSEFSYSGKWGKGGVKDISSILTHTQP